MKYRRRLLLAILVYVALDLSLPTMPGAFVFEPADSTEATHIRARSGAEMDALPTQPSDSAAALCRVVLEVKERLAPVSAAERRGRPVVRWRTRASDESALSSEDPH